MKKLFFKYCLRNTTYSKLFFSTYINLINLKLNYSILLKTKKHDRVKGLSNTVELHVFLSLSLSLSL